MNRLASISFVLLATLPAAALADEPRAASEPQARRISLSEAISIAAKESPEVEAAAAGIDAAEARVRQVKAQRLPSLSLGANLLFWDEEIVFVPAPGMELTVRERVTASATVTAAQPITPLLVLGQLIELERAGANAARAEHDRARLDAQARAAEAYLRVLQARAGRDVAAKLVAQVEANLERVRKLEAAGAAGGLDVLRLEAARDGAKQALIRSESQVVIAERALVLSLDLPDGTRLDPYDDLPEPPAKPAFTSDDAAKKALAVRPELRAARERVTQASQARRVAWANYIPNISAIGQYQHAEGQGAFAEQDTWFVGLTLSWTAFEWGRTGAAVDEARARETQAKIGETAVADQVVFDARRRADEAITAYEALASARTALTAAEEAYRLQTIRNEQGVSTTTDVLDAETEVTRARTSYVLARYDYFLSLVALARSVGDAPSAP
jgi:outer membrane protein TolC